MRFSARRLIASFKPAIASCKTESRVVATQNFPRLRWRPANHFSPIRSFLIDSDLRQARAVRFMQNIFAQDLRCTKRPAVAKTIAIAGEESCCAERAKNLDACKKTLFHRVFCNSRLAGNLQGFYRALHAIVSVNDVITSAHDVSDSSAIHIG